ncbi:serine protease [Streptomyces sp. NPDC091371]|uniref:serine protease n=1 Tax=Streptomyces sp. NPDC091371 TaxID=3155303 RepID=UPI00341BB6E5
MFSIAVGRLVPDNDPAGRVGSAFVISDEYALTAWHVLCPSSGCAASGEQPTATGRLVFADGATTFFELEDHDAELDVALLRITSPPANLRSVPLGALRFPVDDAVLAVGWPLARPFSGDLDHVRAVVVTPDTTIFGGVPSLKLYSSEAAAGKALQGLSGGPVLFRTSADVGTGPGYAVGVVRWNPPRPDGTALGGTFYATPVDLVTRRWPDLLRFVPPRRNLPSASKIEQFLADQLGTAVDHRPFGGRAAELGRLDAWLRSADGPPCMLVTAPSGAGKSTLLARWWQQLANTPSDEESSLFVPISARHDIGGADAVLQAAVARLAVLHHEDPMATQAASIDQLRDRLADYLALPAPHQGRLVLIVDGLDESLGWDVSPTLLRPAGFGSGVHVAVSARLTAQRPDTEAWRDALGWSPGSTASLHLLPLTEDGVAAALRSLKPPLEETLRDRARPILHHVTHGDALVLGLYLQELQDASDRPAWLADLEHLPAPYGLDGYMQRWWAGQELLWRGPIASRGARVGQLYSLLACALGPIRRLDLLWIAKQFGLLGGDELNAALHDLGRWVITDSARSPTDTTYSLSHPRLAEHRRGELARDGELSTYDDVYLSWGRSTLEAVRQDGEAARAAHTYPVRFYGAHLERAYASAAELFALAGADWRAAWEFATEEFQGHLGDVRRALLAAEAENDDAIASGRMATRLPEQIACQAAIVETSVNAALITPGLVAQLRHHSLWTDRQALAYVQSITTPYERGHALRLVAPELSRAATEHAAVLCTALQEEGEPEAVAEALVGYALHLTGTGQVDRALSVLSALPHEYQQAHVAAALELVRVVTGETRARLVRTLFRLAESEPPDRARGTVQAMAEQIDRETAAAAIGRDPALEAFRLLGAHPPLAPTSVAGVWAQTDLLKVVAPWIPDADWPQISQDALAVQARKILEEADGELNRVRRRKERAINDQKFNLATLLLIQEQNLIMDRRELAAHAERTRRMTVEPELALGRLLAVEPELMPYLSGDPGEVAAMVMAYGAQHFTRASLGRLLARLDDQTRADTLRDLAALLLKDPERADRRELLHAMASLGHVAQVLVFVADHPALPGLREDLGRVFKGV